ncbi:MarR family winged helix-turn-helix transcriptional regulator [Pseudonocardia dioxanivorans]|uniref:MarR family winged helix-turn-helix transcriptional regulator n=1 Tax=Pseudonocardia dioxanivorans TaxID=240495 RepID=UPI00131A4DE1|nr:MarR family transcriptional regulator [Pseudonocardia dioxanivorans]
MSSTSDATPDSTGSLDGESDSDIELAARAWSRELAGIDTDWFLVTTTIQRLAQQVEREFADVARRHGLRAGDLRVLLALRRSPEYRLSPAQLFRHLLITSGAVSKQIDQLAEAGHVVRRADPDSPRGIQIHLEPSGHRVAEEAMREISTSFCGLDQLSTEDRHEALRATMTLEHLFRLGRHAVPTD